MADSYSEVNLSLLVFVKIAEQLKNYFQHYVPVIIPLCSLLCWQLP